MKRQSLTTRTIRTTLISSFVLAFVALFIGLSIYGSQLVDDYVRRSYEIARDARFSVRHSADSIGLSKQVMEIYHSLTPEQRSAEDYFEHFAGIDTSMNGDSDYAVLFNVLQGHIVEVDDVYLGMYDRETNTLVYIVDPDADESTRLRLGEWETVSEEECLKFLDWDGEGMLYDISDEDKYGWMCTAGYPITDENGEICYFILADVMLGRVTEGLINYALKVGLALLAATAVIAWFIARHMQKMVAEPVNEIAEAAAAYVEDKKNGIERSHFKDPGTRAGYEIHKLAEVMEEMESELAQHEERITRITAEKERINTELNMARKIQAGMLPNFFPPFPDCPEFDIYATMEPAREIGGDFYDFYLVDDDHLCLVMADVSGKGVPAALFMMTTKAMIHSSAMLGHSAVEILKNTNETLCSNNQLQMFVTAWVGILEISTGKIRAANAGHEYPALMKNGKFSLLKDRHGFVIGGMENVKYTEYEISLEPGDRLFLYTDGVTEASDEENRMFGTERMIAALNEDPTGSPKQILQNVRTAVGEFVRDAEQFDDLTMMCFEYKG